MPTLWRGHAVSPAVPIVLVPRARKTRRLAASRLASGPSASLRASELADGASFAPFPHPRLQAYGVARDFVRLINATPIADTEMGKHALGSRLEAMLAKLTR